MPYPVPPPETALTVQVDRQSRVTPDTSPLTAATSAALLGPGFSVGYRLQPSAIAQDPTLPQNHPEYALLAFVPGSDLGIGSLGISRLLTKDGGGTVREFQIDRSRVPEKTALQLQQQTPQPQAPTEIAPPRTPAGVLELNADTQQFDAERQVVTAEGNVALRFQQALLNADRVEINLQNRLAIAQGNVVLTRGEQVLRGDRFEYNFAQDSGVVLGARGEIFQPTLARDVFVPLPTDVGSAIIPQLPLSDRLAINQPLQQLTNPGGIGIVVGDERAIPNPNLPQFQQGGTLTRGRFEAERIQFEGTTINATDVRITNDPFSPPELEIRADSAEFRQISPLQSEITASRPRLVFDQGFTLPIPRNRITIDQQQRDPGFPTIGYDTRDRDGLFLEQTFEPINQPGLRVRVTPQYFLQRVIQEGKYLNPDALGVRARVDATLSPRTTFEGNGIVTGFDLNNLENRVRANLRLRQVIGTTQPHNLNVEYSYRDRLFNGSLGFQNVQSSFGAVLTSPIVSLGNTGVSLSYQGSAQLINAESDRLDLLNSDRDNNRISLGRYQASASVSRGFLLSQGQALPPTPTEGLRYTPVPVVPYLQVLTGLTGVATGYSNGDTQNSLNASVGIQGQIGNFSRPFLDYTGFNLTYSQVLPTGQSPFLFDRIADTRVLSGGINQQLYGPFRLGIQTSLNLDNNRQISTDYFLEYSRRTYNLLLRYNPVLAIGSVSFRLNDFNWAGNPEPFGGREVRPVVQGVTR